jgi:hypothetical protein
VIVYATTLATIFGLSKAFAAPARPRASSALAKPDTPNPDARAA